ncbi:SMI1 / KNR4 family (SUKH-1) [Streptomyces sp. SceaMP-e96]|nr:SMI1/KNR4 family protein [Streptomyces sp. SID4951]SCK06305.1 SMI1 / KNR4 family (SUKH-1) [Streptomyces sp. SceaMP-e96]
MKSDDGPPAGQAGCWDAEAVRARIGELALRDPEFTRFGSDEHRYRLTPPLPEAALRAFEERHAVRLPDSYRAFLARVGGSGAGPQYGLLPLDEPLPVESEDAVDDLRGTGPAAGLSGGAFPAPWGVAGQSGRAVRRGGGAREGGGVPGHRRVGVRGVRPARRHRAVRRSDLVRRHDLGPHQARTRLPGLVSVLAAALNRAPVPGTCPGPNCPRPTCYGPTCPGPTRHGRRAVRPPAGDSYHVSPAGSPPRPIAPGRPRRPGPRPRRPAPPRRRTCRG